MADNNLDIAEIATVHSQIGDEVLVSVKLEGFPAGFQLRPGDQVALMHSESGMLAHPLVQSEVVDSVAQAGLMTAASGAVDIEFSSKGAYPQELTASDGTATTVRAWTIQTTRSDYSRLVVGARAEPDSDD